MVFYRKYRPQTIAELDNPKLRDTLYAVFSSKDIPHSFLFTGPKGLGKTSTARIIAKVLNCEHSSPVIANPDLLGVKQSHKNKEEIASSSTTPRNDIQIEPCNLCPQCTSITNGTNMDVIEIDGASNRGIDEIRDLRDKVKLAPSSAKKKVYIIDEVHMLTTEAFNALLKTIEEPPEHVVFIFCTTEPQKVPATIISRCFHISLNRATNEELLHSLQRIVDQEKVHIDKDALEQIADLGDGGFRDTQKLFEEVVALSRGVKITKELVEEKLGVSGISYMVSSMLSHLEQKAVKECLEIIKQSIQQGVDSKYLITQLLSALHELLLKHAGVSILNTKYKILDTRYSLEDIQELVSLLQNAYQQTKYAVVPSLPLELAVVKWCLDEGSKETKESNGTNGSKESKEEYQPTPERHSERSKAPNQKSVQGEESLAINKLPSPSLKNDNTKPTVDTLLTKERNLKVQAIIKGTNGATSDVANTKESKVMNTTQNNLPQDISDMSHLLENIIYKVKPYNHSVAGVLRGCTIQSIGTDKITFQTAYKFHKERLDDGKIKEILEKIIREVTGKQLVVMIELKS